VDEEEILAAERHDPQGMFSGVVVDADARVAEESTERTLVLPRVLRRAPEQRLGPCARRTSRASKTRRANSGLA